MIIYPERKKEDRRAAIVGLIATMIFAILFLLLAWSISLHHQS